MTRAVSEARTSLENQKRKTRRPVKTSARYITHPALRTQWEVEKQENAHAQRERTEKEAQMATEDAARRARIHSEITKRTFSGALLSTLSHCTGKPRHPAGSQIFWALPTGSTAVGRP